MKHSLTYLDNTTIVTFNRAMVIIDENLEGWEVVEDNYYGCLTFKDKDKQFRVYHGGLVEWYQCHPGGKLMGYQYHRDDGPAIIYSDGSKQWWRKGIQIADPALSEEKGGP